VPVGGVVPGLGRVAIEGQREEIAPAHARKRLLTDPAGQPERDVLRVGRAVELFVGDLDETVLRPLTHDRKSAPDLERRRPFELRAVGPREDRRRRRRHPLRRCKRFDQLAARQRRAEAGEPRLLCRLAQRGAGWRLAVLDGAGGELNAGEGVADQQNLARPRGAPHDEARHLQGFGHRHPLR
jgi:hypothetical protein